MTAYVQAFMLLYAVLLAVAVITEDWQPRQVHSPAGRNVIQCLRIVLIGSLLYSVWHLHS